MYRTGPLVAAIVIALALASCGGGGTSSAVEETIVTGTGEGHREAADHVQPPKNAATKSGVARSGDGGCEKQLGEFVARMNDLRQSLLAGLSYAEYVVRVRAIRDAYEAVPVKKLGADCLAGAAAKAEDALNQYLRAANTWGDCAATAGCAASEIEGKLQHRWHIASKSLDAATRSS